MGSIIPQYLFYFQDIDSTNQSLTKLKYDVDGWKNYGVTFGRETGISNVVKSYTQSWTFIKEDAKYLKDKLLNFGPNRRIRFIVKRLTDALARTYAVEYSGYADLTQMTWDANTATVPITEGGFFKALENSWDREYTIPNEAVCDFTGSVLDVNCETTTTDECSAGASVSSTIGYFVIGGTLQNTDNGQDNIFRNVPPKFLDATFDPYSQNPMPTDTFHSQLSKSDAALVMRNGGTVENLRIRTSLSFDARGNEFQFLVDNTTYQGRWTLYLVAADESVFSGDRFTPDPHVNCRFTQMASQAFYYSVPALGQGQTYLNKTIPVSASADYTLSGYDCGTGAEYFYVLLRIHWGDPYCGGIYDYRFAAMTFRLNANEYTTISTENVQVAVTYDIQARVNSSRYISGISVRRTFLKLIERITDGRYSVNVSHSALDGLGDEDMLVSGSGMRGTVESAVLGDGKYPLGNLTTSLQDFLKFVYVCYSLHLCVDYDRDTGTYSCRLDTFQNIYSSTRIATLENVSDVQISVDRTMLYTSIAVGYDTDDDVLSGQSEFNCRNTYDTPNTELESNELSLESPYSAAGFSIDTYILKNYGNSSDATDDDGKIYVIGGILRESRQMSSFYEFLFHSDLYEIYGVDRSIPVDGGVPFPETVFNVKFSPARILARHQLELQSYFHFNVWQSVTLNTCGYNSRLVADGIAESNPLLLGDAHLFVPVTVQLKASARESLISAIEANRTGYFEFGYEGQTYKGFIARNSAAVTVNPMNEKANEFTLLAADVPF